MPKEHQECATTSNRCVLSNGKEDFTRELLPAFLVKESELPPNQIYFFVVDGIIPDEKHVANFKICELQAGNLSEIPDNIRRVYEDLLNKLAGHNHPTRVQEGMILFKPATSADEQKMVADRWIFHDSLCEDGDEKRVIFSNKVLQRILISIINPDLNPQWSLFSKINPPSIKEIIEKYGNDYIIKEVNSTRGQGKCTHFESDQEFKDFLDACETTYFTVEQCIVGTRKHKCKPYQDQNRLYCVKFPSKSQPRKLDKTQLLGLRKHPAPENLCAQSQRKNKLVANKPVNDLDTEIMRLGDFGADIESIEDSIDKLVSTIHQIDLVKLIDYMLSHKSQIYRNYAMHLILDEPYFNFDVTYSALSYDLPILPEKYLEIVFKFINSPLFLDNGNHHGFSTDRLISFLTKQIAMHIGIMKEIKKSPESQSRLLTPKESNASIALLLKSLSVIFNKCDLGDRDWKHEESQLSQGLEAYTNCLPSNEESIKLYYDALISIFQTKRQLSQYTIGSTEALAKSISDVLNPGSHIEGEMQNKPRYGND